MSTFLHAVTMAYPHTSATQQRLCDIAIETTSCLQNQVATMHRIYRGTSVDARGAVIMEACSDHSRATQSLFPIRLHDDAPPASFQSQAGEHTQQTASLALDAPTTGDRMKVWLRELTPLAIEAARSALRDSGFSSNSVTHLVTASCTGFASPGIDHAVMQELDLKATVQRVHVGFMGCHGAINALRVAQGMIALNAANVVLLIAAEACSVHFQTENLTPDRIIANALFADGAGACVLAGCDAPAARIDTLHPPADDRVRECCCLGILKSTASWAVPHSEHAMSWTIGDQGFVMSLSKDVPALIEGTIAVSLGAWLDQHALKVGDIPAWCIHPGGPKVLDAVQRALGLSDAAMEPSRRVLREHGNMSSPTVLAILKSQTEMIRTVPTPCVLLAFGPGLTCEAALIGNCSG